MATFVLVHGSFFGGWCYSRLTPFLRAAGHRVFTPTLTGLGERSHLLTEQVDLETHIQDVVNVMTWEDLNDVILCGHSSGGMAITGAADRVAQRIRALIYLDAVVPQSGDSLLDRLPAKIADGISNALAASSLPWLAPPDATPWVTRPEDRTWVNSKTTPQPKRTLLQKLHLTNDYLQVALRAFVYVEGGPHESRHREFLGQPGCAVESFGQSRHALMIDQPQVLAYVLSRYAQLASTRSESAPDSPAH